MVTPLRVYWHMPTSCVEARPTLFLNRQKNWPYKYISTHLSVIFRTNSRFILRLLVTYEVTENEQRTHGVLPIPIRYGTVTVLMLTYGLIVIPVFHDTKVWGKVSTYAHSSHKNFVHRHT